jgi:hypothetical protein
MARISVVGNPFSSLLLWDLDKVQQMREHTINPKGQERYIKPLNLADVQSILDAHNSGAGTTEDAAAVVAATVAVDDISLAAIQGAVTEVLAAEAVQAIQDALSIKFVETGNFLLSFNNGVIAKAVEKGWVKVFTDTGETLYSL